MSDHPSDPEHQDHPSIVSRNARYGMILFIVYALVYAGFIALSTFAPSLMARPVLSGVNLAVVYGFGLILLAFILAMLYMYMVRGNGDRTGGQL